MTYLPLRYSAVLLISISCVIKSMQNMPNDIGKLWETGFGAVRGNNLLSFQTSLLGGVLLANLPQTLLSYLYPAGNAFYTTMLISAEYANYSIHRKTLRVTSPVGQQRSSYWLGIPFRFGVPMNIMSGLFHWLTSQSLFKVQISITDPLTRAVTREISTCGYSPVAIILTTVVAAVFAGGGIFAGIFHFLSGMPVASSNSAAVSAACYRPSDDIDASVLPVKWGAITHGDENGAGQEPIGHCCFSSFEVDVPIEGRMYK